MDKRIVNSFNKIYSDLNLTKISQVTDFITSLKDENQHQIITKYNLKNIKKSDWQLLIESVAINVLIKNDYDFNQQLTPPLIGLIFSEIILVLLGKQNNSFNIVDFGSGTGSLVFSILKNLKNENINIIAIDNNEELLSFSKEYRELFDFNNSVEFIFNDVLTYDPLEKIDFVVSDLPVGYYPIQMGIDKFEVNVSDNLTYIQNLFIEKALQILNEDGFAIFVAPDNIFTSNQNSVLLSMLRERAYIQGIIGLPQSGFTEKKFVKNIVVLQKKGPKSHQIAPILLYRLNNTEELKNYQKLFTTLSAWSQEINNTSAN